MCFATSDRLSCSPPSLAVEVLFFFFPWLWPSHFFFFFMKKERYVKPIGDREPYGWLVCENEHTEFGQVEGHFNPNHLNHS